jgi:hypothetical protein
MIGSRHFAVVFALCGLLAPALAHAQQDDDLIPTARNWISPERFIFETRFGPYHPDKNDLPGFRTFFADDSGPAIGLELDVIAYRLDDILYVTGGGGIGTVHFTGNTLDMATGQETSEENDFSILPLDLVATVRIDALARMLGIPFIVTGKVGYEWARWSTNSGSKQDANGWSVGLTYAAQLGLDLDTFEPRAARAMDEEWGINHSFLFFELYEFAPSKQSLPIGNLQWCAGLGFTF